MTPSRPRVTYENVALFQSMGEKAHSHSFNSGSGLSFVPHVQSIDFSFDMGRQSAGAMGSKKLITQGAKLNPDVNFNISAIETFGSLFSNYFQDGDRVRSDLNIDKNFYAVIGKDRGKPVTGENISGQTNIAFGNCFLNGISMSQNVNGLLQSQYSFVASNMIGQEIQERKHFIDSNLTTNPSDVVTNNSSNINVTDAGTITDELGTRRDNCIQIRCQAKDGDVGQHYISFSDLKFQIFGSSETGVDGSANGTNVRLSTQGNHRFQFDCYIPTPRTGLGKNENEHYTQGDCTNNPYRNKYPVGLRGFIGGFGAGNFFTGSALGKSGADINSLPETTGFSADGFNNDLHLFQAVQTQRTGKWFRVTGFNYRNSQDQDSDGNTDRGRQTNYIRDGVGLRMYLTSGTRRAGIPGSEFDTAEGGGVTRGEILPVGTATSNVNFSGCTFFMANVSGFVVNSGQHKRFTGIAPSVNLTGGNVGQRHQMKMTMNKMSDYFLNKNQATGESIPYYSTNIKVKKRRNDIPLDEYRVLNGEAFTGFKPEVPTKLYASFASDYINDGNDSDQGALRIKIDDEVVYDCNDTGLGFRPINRGFILARVSTNGGIYKFEEGDIFDTFQGFTGANSIYSGHAFHRSIVEASGFMQRFNTGDILFAMSSDTPIISHKAKEYLNPDDSIATTPIVALPSGLRQPFRDDFNAQFAYTTGHYNNQDQDGIGTTPHRGAYALIAQKGKGVIYEEFLVRTGHINNSSDDQDAPKGCVYLPKDDEFLAPADQIQGFNLDIPIARKSVYALGEKMARRRKALYPNEGTFSFSNIVSELDVRSDEEHLISDVASQNNLAANTVSTINTRKNLSSFFDNDDAYDIEIFMKNQKGEKHEFEIKNARLNSQDYSTSIGSEMIQNVNFSFDTQKLKKNKLIDKYNSVDHAYSLQKVNSQYDGYGVRVRRSRDGIKADVYFDENGKISDNSRIDLVEDNVQFGNTDLRVNSIYGGIINRPRTFREFLIETFPQSNMELGDEFGSRRLLNGFKFDGLSIGSATGFTGAQVLLHPATEIGGFDGTGSQFTTNATYYIGSQSLSLVKTGSNSTSEIAINLGGGAVTGDSFILTMMLESQFTGSNGGIVNGTVTGFSAGGSIAAGGDGVGGEDGNEFLLLENGSFALLQDSNKILLAEQGYNLKNHSATWSIKNAPSVSGGRTIADFSGFVVQDSGVAGSFITRHNFLCKITGSGMATGTRDYYDTIYLTAEADHPVAQVVANIGFLQRKSSASIVTWYDQVGNKDLTGHHNSQSPIIARGGRVLDYVRFNEHNSNLLNFPVDGVEANSIYWVGRVFDQGAQNGRNTGPDANGNFNINGFLGYDQRGNARTPYIFFIPDGQSNYNVSLDGNFAGGGTGGALSGYWYKNNEDNPMGLGNNVAGGIKTGQFFQHTYKYESFSGTTIWNRENLNAGQAGTLPGFNSLGQFKGTASESQQYFGTFDIKELLLSSGKDAGGAAHRKGIQKDLVERYNI